jgi:hypothetical protein
MAIGRKRLADLDERRLAEALAQPTDGIVAAPATFGAGEPHTRTPQRAASAKVKGGSSLMARLGTAPGQASGRVSPTPFGTSAGCSLRFHGPKTAGSVNKIDHLGCCMDRQRMRGEARSWCDKSCHFASKIELPIGCFRE